MLDKRAMILASRDLRKSMTPCERSLWYGFLRHYSEKIYRQKVVGRFILDFYCPKAKLAIEVDGKQHYTPDGMSRDNERTMLLNCHGIEVVRFTNEEVNTCFGSVCHSIDKVIQQRLQ